ncbi:MAG: ribonuclease P protein component [Bacteroidales bacterium]|jgi:ribonuclease P protein component|nr:ribonuclease P protein component [Bacteroidales bacterium]
MHENKGHTLCKAERLHGKRAMSELFVSGKSVFRPPFKAIWTTAALSACPAAVAVAVPKRLFKHAVQRNLLKRRTREAFRLNKQLLDPAANNGRHIRLMLIYTAEDTLPYAQIATAVQKILRYIACHVTTD